MIELAVTQGEESLLPEIRQYLDNSPDCCEEFEAVVAIMRAEQAMLLADSELDEH